MNLNFLDPSQRELAPQKRDQGASYMMVRSVDRTKRTVTAAVSTPNVDRYEEIVEPKAFKLWLPTFMANPVFCAGHQYVGLSGEPTVIGSWQSMDVTDKELVGTAQFANTPLADQYLSLFAENHMRAFSVGWITHEWEMREFDMGEGIKKRIRVFTEVELIEVSAVAIPANRQSLVRAASAGVPAGTGLIDYDQLADKVLAKLSPGLAKAIKEQLNTDPGGHLCTLIQDVVMSTQGQGDQGDDDDDVPENDPAPVDKGHSSELKSVLVGIKEALKADLTSIKPKQGR